ncbi:MAG: hypothetical protein QM817_32805 [Archangium sp.]
MRTLLVVIGSIAVTMWSCGRPCATAKCPEQCIDDVGRTNGVAERPAPSVQGSCGGSVTCTTGCSCSGAGDGGTPSCLCTGALPPSGFVCVSTPNCGAISCGNNCSCADAGASICSCN